MRFVVSVGFVVSAQTVIPAEAGIPFFTQENQNLGSRLRGNDERPIQ